jgi:hypothetical protein
MSKWKIILVAMSPAHLFPLFVMIIKRFLLKVCHRLNGSKRYKMPEFGICSVVGCDFNVWREKIHLKWWDARIDSPKYIDDWAYSITVWLDK